MKTDKAPELKLEIKRLRTVDLDKISGGVTIECGGRTGSECGAYKTQATIAVSGG